MSARPLQLSWWLTDPRTGQRVVAQRPNLPSLVMTTATALERLPVPTPVRRGARLVGAAAMAWWAWLEITRGASPIRRVLGVIGAVMAIRSLVAAAQEATSTTVDAVDV